MLQLYVIPTYIGRLILSCVQDPDVVSALSDPEVMAALQDGISTCTCCLLYVVSESFLLAVSFIGLFVQFGTAGRVVQSLLDNRIKS